MANVLPEKAVQDIRNLAMQGLGVRAVSRSLGISKNTVARYYPEKPGACGCGQPTSHKGWCKFRYEKSQARKAFHASRSGKVVSVPDPIKFSRLSTQQRAYLRWNGKDGKKYDPIEPWEMYGAIGEASRATKRYPAEFREEVFQELVLRCLEGRVYPDEIKLAAKYMLMGHLNALFAPDTSIDETWDDGSSKYDSFLAIQPDSELADE